MPRKGKPLTGRLRKERLIGVITLVLLDSS